MSRALSVKFAGVTQKLGFLLKLTSETHGMAAAWGDSAARTALGNMGPCAICPQHAWKAQQKPKLSRAHGCSHQARAP
eukprot:1073691-Prymnesium_polylepis.1